MSADRISLVNFMFEMANDIRPSLEGLDLDTTQSINELMFDALCSANDGDAEEVKRLVWLVRWKLKRKLERGSVAGAEAS